MSILLAAAAFVAAQASPSAPIDHSQHNAAQHQQVQQAQHEDEHKCCKKVDGKMECKMMKGGKEHGQSDHQG